MVLPVEEEKFVKPVSLCMRSKRNRELVFLLIGCKISLFLSIEFLCVAFVGETSPYFSVPFSIDEGYFYVPVVNQDSNLVYFVVSSNYN